jgi:hypothetical protein
MDNIQNCDSYQGESVFRLRNFNISPWSHARNRMQTPKIKIVIVILIYHPHKPIDIINLLGS